MKSMEYIPLRNSVRKCIITYMGMILENVKCVEVSVNSMGFIRDIESVARINVWEYINMIIVMKLENVLFVMPTFKFIKKERRPHVLTVVY